MGNQKKSTRLTGTSRAPLKNFEATTFDPWATKSVSWPPVNETLGISVVKMEILHMDPWNDCYMYFVYIYIFTIIYHLFIYLYEK